MSSTGRTIQMIRTARGFAPWSDVDREQVGRIKVGQVCRVVVRVIRNWRFHRKVFSLFQFAYDQWEPAGNAQYRNFEAFREELTIAAGFYEIVLRLDGVTQLRAKSLSFGSMGEQEFEEVFKGLKAVVWSHVMANKGTYTPEQFENVLAQLLEYDA